MYLIWDIQIYAQLQIYFIGICNSSRTFSLKKKKKESIKGFGMKWGREVQEHWTKLAVMDLTCERAECLVLVPHQES